MLKLVPRYKQGNKSPDHDPDNPYHYHTGDGKKVVITPEDWEANVGKPYFKEIEDAVRAEQAAYPEPEYEVNPDFVRDLRSTYRSNMGNGYQNYRNFSSYLPQGYTFTSEGMIVDPQGNYYVQSGYRQSPRFTYSTDNPLQFTINKGKPIERNLTFYPVNMDKRVKAPLPIDRVLNVGEEREKAVNKYMEEPIYKYKFNIPNYGGLTRVQGKPITDDRVYFAVKTRDGNYRSYGAAKDYGNLEQYANMGLRLDKDGKLPKPSDVYKHLGLDKNGYGTKEQMDALNERFIKLGYNDHDYDLFDVETIYPSHQEAEKKAVISIGPLEKVNTFATGGHLYKDGGSIKIGYAAGGKLKLIPRALRGISFSVILQPAVADNTRYVRPYTSIEIAKSKKAYEQEQLQKLIEAAQERLPLLKADTRSTEQRQRDHNRVIQLEVKQKANELAANFGRALGANHDMTVDEVNQNTLNTANLMGYMVAPYLMTTLESGYYLGTGRPKEAAITAGIGYGLPALNKPLANVSNTTKAIAVSNRLKKGIKNTTLPAQEPLIDVNPIYNFIDNGTPFNGKLPLIGYVKGNLELFPNRPLILRPEKSYHTIDRAYLESSLPDFVKDSGLRNMLKQTYESISESTPSSELVTSINHTLGIEPKIPNDKFITGGVDKVKWLNDKPIFISKTPEEIYHPKFVRDAYRKPNEQVVDETYDIFRQRILDKFGIKLKENYDAKDIEDAFYSLETPTTDDFSKVMHNERWYNPDFNDDQKLFAEYFNQYFGLKNKNFVSYIDLKNAVKEGLQFGIDYLKSPGFTERATNMLNKYGFSYSPSDFKLNSRKVTWMPEFMNADSSLLFGLSSRRRLPFRLGGTATHEVFHWNPKFNTRINSSKGITLTKPADSPYYSNNYNNIPEDVKAILRPNKEKLIARELKGLGDLKHDAEISESYSDLGELRYNLKKEGIFDSFKSGEKFDLHMLDLFRKTKRGKTDRFIDLHNDDQIIKAVNEIAQNGNEEISYV